MVGLPPVSGFQQQELSGHPYSQMQPWLAVSRGSGQDCIPVTNNADAEDVTVCWVAPIKLVPNIACQMTPAIIEDSK